MNKTTIQINFAGDMVFYWMKKDEFNERSGLNSQPEKGRVSLGFLNDKGEFISTLAYRLLFELK